MSDESLVTRRRLIEAGGVAAGGVMVLGLPAAADGQARGRRIGSGPTDRHGVGILMAVRQDGPALVGVGYLTRVRGLGDGTLFTTPPATKSTDPRASDPGPARFTFHSRATIESLAQLGASISSTGKGRVRIFFQANGGARFDDPDSFARGIHIATLAGVFQNDLAVSEPNVADVSMAADLTQTFARRFSTTARGRRLVFGGNKFAWALRATGRGRRSEPDPPRSELTLSGDLGVVDARPVR